jgi:leucyl/phenylalanyl-tRNA--protein transferase
MIPWLREGTAFPPVERALAEPNGLLCASDCIDASMLIAAYRRGIFPWYSEGEPVLWWSPDPRMILRPDEFRVGRSLRKTLRRAGHSADAQLWLDRAFERVMRACAQPRAGQQGTWITEPLIAAYVDLHRQGLAHSVELWRAGRLVGGLYGVAIGRMFYGESMFARETDASKCALAGLMRILLREQVPVIDCQQNTSHLASLGAREIARREFCAHVARAVQAAPIDWKAYAAAPLNPLLLSD